MKILLTGASSFTGCWFASAMAEAGHEVHATFTRSCVDDYGSDVRSRRAKRIVEQSKPLFLCRFGDDRFLEVLKREKFDLLCHHAADATDYKSPSFDVCRAVSNNTLRALEVLKALAANSGSAFLLTGSVFEAGEGAGSDGLPSFSPYGLSKALTAEVFSYYARALGLRSGKFVIPNPFGPLEDARFTAYLMRTWSGGDVATIRTPSYIRDNIHVSLLAQAYVHFAEGLPATDGFTRINPSGYVESQGAFSERMAREMRTRTGWACQLEHACQTEFDEPLERINTEPVDGRALGWDESAAWDALAEWYVP